MPSFDAVDFKLAEADFFLGKLRNKDTNPFPDANYYFSAFVTAARSVTFSLQSAMKGIDGFEGWYARKQEELRSDPLSRWFVEARNLVQKRGKIAIVGGSFRRDEHGKHVSLLHFDEKAGIHVPESVSNDVGTLSALYMKRLVQLVFDCYVDFGPVIDPDQYYTLENLTRLSLTLEDVEESLGFPRGWTGVSGIPDDERLSMLRRSIPGSRIKSMFSKYLEKQPY